MRGGRFGRFLATTLAPSSRRPARSCSSSALVDRRVADRVQRAARAICSGPVTSDGPLVRRRPRPHRCGASPTARRAGRGDQPVARRGRARRPGVQRGPPTPGQTGLWSKGGDADDRGRHGSRPRCPASARRPPTFAPARSGGLALGHARRRSAAHGPRARRHHRRRRLAADQGADRVRPAAARRSSRTSPTRPSPAAATPPTSATRRSSSRSSRASGSPAQIVTRNAGPVVTQYEVQPARRRQGLADRGPGRRPGDGPRRPLAPDRGADPGQERRRDRDPEQGLQHRRPPPDPRGGRVHGRRSRS